MNLFVLHLFRITVSLVPAIVIAMVFRLLFKKLPAKYTFLLWLPVLIRMFASFAFRLPVRIRPSAIEYDFNSKRGTWELIPPNVISGTLNDTLKIADYILPINASLIAAVWASGVLIMVALYLISRLRIRKRLAYSVRIEDNIYETDMPDAPFVCGILRNRIYLPYNMNESLRLCVLEHEKFHIRMLDPMFKFLFYVGLSLNWFNPLAHLAFYLMSRDMERRADEGAMAKSEEIRVLYPEALLAIAETRMKRHVLSFSEKPVKKRILKALAYKKHGKLLSVFSLLSLFCPWLCLLPK